ncbi:VOC family protein [Prauserella cavernicola]|uniref:VOC family protein n=1 Tax=Prauserella cavernicola TaxID=2800127 RepID=A0A934V380_9PSEU|nr:VOC family protein [Prauserella cavernicola]MBK1783354.1 VOC family protein [Prauserella cavernicola]
MLRGLTTVSLFADDLTAARRWYTELLGVEPYFERSANGQTAYLEYRIGDYSHELGLIDRRFAPGTPDGGGAGIAYWAVDDVSAAYARLLSLGASPHREPFEHGPGFVTASVTDPFGNVLGVMFNQHYLDVLADSSGG